MLTGRQSQIIDFIRLHLRTHGCGPTVSEIQGNFSFKSPNAVTKHLDALSRKGIITRIAGSARNIRFVGVHRPAPILHIPIFGAISAGFSISTEAAAIERTMAVDAESFGLREGASIFGLAVRGASMTGVGIFDGDTVLLEHGADPRDGEVVAALIDDETSLKTFRKPRGKAAYLQAEHPDFPDLIPVRSLTIQGVFRALIRVGGRDER